MFSNNDAVKLPLLLQNFFRVKVKVWAVADNCLLTVWPYLALHRSEQQIVLKAGMEP